MTKINGIRLVAADFSGVIGERPVTTADKRRIAAACARFFEGRGLAPVGGGLAAIIARDCAEGQHRKRNSQREAA